VYIHGTSFRCLSIDFHHVTYSSFSSTFNVLAHNLLRPYRIIEFYYMLSWIYSALEIPPSRIPIIVRAKLDLDPSCHTRLVPS
jgi:hypothetical protein